MTTPPLFPALPGQGYPLIKTPDFSTGIFTGVSGIRLRQIKRISVLWNFELTYEALDSAALYPGVGPQTWQELGAALLAGFGAAQNWLLLDPTDCTLVNAQIATGDGATTTFAVARPLSVAGLTYLEPVGWVNSGDISSIKVGGTTTAYTFTAPNLVTFASAPAAASAITCSANPFYFQVTLPDEIAFEQFLYNLWDVKSLKLRSLVPNYPALVLG